MQATSPVHTADQMTAHELARKLLAGGDYTIVIGSGSTGIASSVAGTVSENALVDGCATTIPVVTLLSDNQAAFETFPYTRSQVG